MKWEGNRMPHHHALLLGVAIVAVGSAAIAPAPAVAEVYRCTGPGGRIIFTDNKATCPGAANHEPGGAVQTIPRDEDPTPAALEPPARDSYADQTRDARAQKAHWQQKKQLKQAELQMLQERHEELGRHVTACNRGMQIIGRDATGIKQRISCDRIRKDYGEIEALQKPLREYLETGLRQECRQAGCLPGWIR